MDSKLLAIHFFLFSRRKTILGYFELPVFFCFLFQTTCYLFDNGYY